MNNDSSIIPNIVAQSKDVAENVKRVMESMPQTLWTHSTPATPFRIRDNVVTVVSADYIGQEGELVFQYKNDNGYISIQQIYPAKDGNAS